MRAHRAIPVCSGLLLLLVLMLSACGATHSTPEYSATKLASCLNQHRIGGESQLDSLSGVAPDLRPFYPHGFVAVLTVPVPYLALEVFAFHSSRDAQLARPKLVATFVLGKEGPKRSRAFAHFWNRGLTQAQIAELHHTIRNLVVLWFGRGRSLKATERYLRPCLDLTLSGQ